MPEEMVVRPLTGEEVQEAVIHKIRESMRRSCNLLATNAYTSFRAEITIRLTLSDHGREVPDNHRVVAQEVTGLPEPDVEHTKEVVITVEPAPPNQVLIETGQKVDVQRVEDGRKVIKSFRYVARKTEPPAPPKDPFNR